MIWSEQLVAALYLAATGPERGDRFAPTPAETFLRQALGSNTTDMRAPILLLSGALMVAMVAMWLRRRRDRKKAWVEADEADASDARP